MTTTTSKTAGEHIDQLIDEVSRSHEPVQIVGQGNSAVLVSEADWRAVQETCYLLSIPGMRESLRDGLNTTLADCPPQLGG